MKYIINDNSIVVILNNITCTSHKSHKEFKKLKKALLNGANEKEIQEIIDDRLVKYTEELLL